MSYTVVFVNSLKDHFFDSLINLLESWRRKSKSEQEGSSVMLKVLQTTFRTSTEVMNIDLGIRRGAILKFSPAMNIKIGNTFLKKRVSHFSHL